MFGRISSWFAGEFSWLRAPSISIGFIDIVEILILAFLVYHFLLWIKNTRAWTLLKGILVIAICVAIVYLLQMNMQNI